MPEVTRNLLRGEQKMGRKNGWLVGLALFLVSPLAFVQAQRILEEQLAGVRLGAPFIDYDEEGRLKPDCLLAIYGMPTYFASGGPASTQPAPHKPQEVAPGIVLVNGELKRVVTTTIIAPSIVPPPPGAGFEQRAVARWSRGGGRLPFAPEVKMRAISVPIGYEPLTPQEEQFWRNYLRLQGLEVPGAKPTMPGTGAGGAAGTTGVAPTFPHPEELPWVIPPFVKLNTNEFHFVYCRHRQGAHLNFLVKLTETEGRKEFRVVAITVAGRRYDGAQTAKGDPFKSIKLGDDLQRVLLRYGLPDEIVYYNPLTLQVVNTPTRNLILRYHLTRNIEFTILGDKVVRIFIFLPGQVTFNRR
jgi:hypothetical protein